MKGDFSRDSFDALRHYSRVLQQQGRLELDADGNERQSIQLYLLRSLAADLIGPHGGPGTGFELVAAVDGKPLVQDFLIRKGHYYVDGWLCENDEDVHYAPGENHLSQPGLPQPQTLERNRRYLAYLDVWERHVTAAETEDEVSSLSPTALREVALGGPDTATRAQVVWQVRVSLGPPGAPLPAVPVTPAAWKTFMDTHWAAWQAQWQAPRRGRLKASVQQVNAAAVAPSPCVISPESRYRGLENQLYRVEIHRGGAVGDKVGPTFVWSRENGSVVFPVERVGDRSVRLADGWRDARLGLEAGDVVELTDDDLALGGQAGPLLRITGVDLDTSTIAFEAGAPAGLVNAARHAVLRRWDHGRRALAPSDRKANGSLRAEVADDLALALTEGRWLALEDGIVVWFEPGPPGEAQQYRSGDYWLIPARTVPGEVLWPRAAQGKHEALALAPQGVEHHYAPLAIVTVAADGAVDITTQPAQRFKTLVELSL